MIELKIEEANEEGARSGTAGPDNAHRVPLVEASALVLRSRGRAA